MVQVLAWLAMSAALAMVLLALAVVWMLHMQRGDD